MWPIRYIGGGLLVRYRIGSWAHGPYGPFDASGTDIESGVHGRYRTGVGLNPIPISRRKMIRAHDDRHGPDNG